MFIYVYALLGKQHKLALVVYGVDEHDVQIRPHGNSKTNSPYCRTMKSTVNKIKEELKCNSPKQSISKIMHSKGGLASSSSAGGLPLSSL